MRAITVLQRHVDYFLAEACRIGHAPADDAASPPLDLSAPRGAIVSAKVGRPRPQLPRKLAPDLLFSPEREERRWRYITDRPSGVAIWHRIHLEVAAVQPGSEPDCRQRRRQFGLGHGIVLGRDPV